MSLNLLIDDSFTRADTVPGAGNNSTTGVGGGWIDFLGNIYCLQAASGGLVRRAPLAVAGVRSPLYQASSSALVNGQVILYVSTSVPSRRGAVFRMNGSSSDSAKGYFAGMEGNGKFIITKYVDGKETELLNEFPRGVTPPSSFVMTVTCQQQETTKTLLTVTISDPANLAVPLASRRFVDDNRALQSSAGIMGVSSGAKGFDASRVLLYAASA